MPITLQERNLAIVLLDIIGSTSFVQRYGAMAAARHFQIHDRLTRNLIYKFNGREIDRSDGFLCSFNRTIDAVNFALIYQATIPKRTGLQTRIGIHWGRVVEVEQDAKYVAINAKKIELEGLAKNIAARTMSLCGPGQVLLTKEAKNNVRNRTNIYTPKATRYACVGLYKFKGVKEPQAIFAVGESIKSLQPPKGNDKVKRLGGPKKIRSRARDRKLLEWLVWLYNRFAIVCFLYIVITFLIPAIIHPAARDLLGLGWFSWVDPIVSAIRRFMEAWQ